MEITKTLSSSKAARTSGVDNAALYIRVSSEEQAMHGLSLGAQQDTLTQYAAANGLNIAALYADEGITARKRYTSRAAFCRMLDDVKAGKINVILFIKMDRWFRNIGDYYEVQRILDDYKVRWIATEEAYDTTTANGRLHLNIKLSIAQDESDRTAERIKFVFDNKVKRGEVISGKVPLGYKIEDKRMAIVPKDAAIVKDLFRKYIGLRSIGALQKYMMHTYGIMYCYTNMKAILTNERYIGRAHGMDHFCPPIIDTKTFAKVGEMIKIRAERIPTGRTDRVYLFTGLVYCAECKNRLSAHCIKQKYIYYRCTRYEKPGLCPHKKRTSELVLEKHLLESMVDIYNTYRLSITEKSCTTSKPIDTDKTKRKMAKLKDLYLNDLIDREAYEKDYRAFTSTLHLAQELLEQTPEPIDLHYPSDILTLYHKLSRQGKKEFWSRIIQRIVITNHDDFFIYPISP